MTYLKVYGERHDNDGHEKIGEGKADDVVVCSSLQRSLAVDGEDDQHITEEGEEREYQEEEGQVVPDRRGRSGRVGGGVDGQRAVEV